MKHFSHAVILFFIFLLAACGEISSDSDYISGLNYKKNEYFPARVVEYRQAPGQYYLSSGFSIDENTEKLLGLPSGGGVYAADHSSSVSLGMAGGYVVLEFDPPILNHPSNMGGYDFIVYGNSFWDGGYPETPSREPGLIEVMKDENGNGEPDDTWYLIPGSHLSTSDMAVNIEYSVDWNDDGSGTLSWLADNGAITGSCSFSGSQPWWSESENPTATFNNTFLLPDSICSTLTDFNEFSDVYGYADIAPALILGDMDGNDSILDPGDDPGMEPTLFYTVPDTHGDNEIDAGSGGGSAIKLEWAVDGNFDPVDLDGISWIKITSASLYVDSGLGEKSCEVDAVVRVRRE